MNIQSIHVENFLGARHVSVATHQPVHLFCGPNAAGKSSVRDAVALALTGDLGRVGLKKEAAQLVTDGAQSAVCAVSVDGAEYRVAITAAGKVHADGTHDTRLAYVLDAQRFAALDPTERRQYLLGLMGVKMDAAAVKARLLARGLPADKVERVAPLLRAGFDATAKDAKAKATEAKGAWRTVTGETWGSEKGKTWRATVPPYDKGKLAEAEAEIKHADPAISSWNQRIGELQAQVARIDAITAALPKERDAAARAAAVRTKLATDEATLAEARAELAKLPEPGEPETKPQAAADLRCPCCDAALLLTDGGLFTRPDDSQDGLDMFADQQQPEPVTAAADRQRWADAVAMAERTVANDRRDLQAATDAQARLNALQAELAAMPATLRQDLEDARREAAKIGVAKQEAQQRLDTLRSLRAQAEAADTKTAQAAGHHADVMAWDAIGDALSPDGIPAEILAEALHPFNDRLTRSADLAQWPRVEVTADMQIRTGLHERPYRLLSESERWRCDAMLAEAISHLSGARLLVLDRFDVLDVPGRQDCLAWLDEIGAAGEVDTALLFGTLKAPPVGLPDTIGVHWLEAGALTTTEPLKEAA